ncbi:MAG: dihydrodipicolinate synthase family protein [Chthoniobacteraceae bacterium]
MTVSPITGLVAATHTPFHQDGSLNPAGVERQCSHLLANGVKTAFIDGTTGESSALTLAERQELASTWMEVSRGTPLKVIVHAGSNCLEDSRVLAAQAQELGAYAVSAVAPSYFKPASPAALIASMAQIAGAAPDLPFYYYEIPTMTGITVSPSDFLRLAGEAIPNLAGLKFTSSNFMEYQLCTNVHEGAFDVPFGFDEMLLGALAFGAKGAVGSTYNFAAPIYLRLIAAFERGDFVAAREEQFRSVRLIQVLVRHGFMAAAKTTMKLLGVDVGPPRLPNLSLTEAQAEQLHRDLAELGFFDWIASDSPTLLA